MELNVAAFQKGTYMTGPGLRDAIWVQGCSILCPGCCNPAYLEHRSRRLISISRFEAHFRTRVGIIDGISILGGEPTEQAESVAELLELVKRLGFSTVVFTGHLYKKLKEEPRQQKLLQFTDLLDSLT